MRPRFRLSIDAPDAPAPPANSTTDYVVGHHRLRETAEARASPPVGGSPRGIGSFVTEVFAPKLSCAPILRRDPRSAADFDSAEHRADHVVVDALGA